MNSVYAESETSFSGNRAASACTTIAQKDEDLYKTHILTELFSAAPAGAKAYTSAYNNFDIAYTDGEKQQLYSVTFNTLNGAMAEVQPVLAGKYAKQPLSPEKQGCEFTGWNTKQDGTGETWRFTLSPITQDLALYAQYSVRSYVVTFDSMGGNGVRDQKTDAGSLLPWPKPPVKEGYVFSGWYLDSECTQKWNFDQDPVNGDLTLYAKWAKKTTTASASSGASGNPAS